jgi:hypothetical protein
MLANRAETPANKRMSPRVVACRFLSKWNEMRVYLKMLTRKEASSSHPCCYLERLRKFDEEGILGSYGLLD